MVAETERIAYQRNSLEVIITTNRLITHWAKLKQEHGTTIREKIRIDINWFCRDVKQVLTPSEWIQIHCTDYGRWDHRDNVTLI